MAEPKKKLTHTRSGNRRSHQRISLLQPSKCKKCGAPVASHQACPECGYYKGKKVIEVK